MARFHPNEVRDNWEVAGRVPCKERRAGQASRAWMQRAGMGRRMPARDIHEKSVRHALPISMGTGNLLV